MAPTPRESTRRLLSLAAGLATVLLLTAGCPAQPAAGTAARKTQAAAPSSQRLAAVQQQLVLLDERIAKLSPDDAARLASFVVGNLYFVLVHEFGHAVISQLELPVLGREEDAADSFATLSMLFVGTELSHTVIAEAARGLWLIAQRDKTANQQTPAYDEHSLDVPRAYQILCLMVGSDQKRFRDVAEIAKIPEERQETCGFDFEQAANSWDKLLNGRRSGAAAKRFFARKPFARKGSSDIRVKYDDPKGKSAGHTMLKAGNVLETVARFGRENLALPRPITIKATTCDSPNAYWDHGKREIVICYELVGEFIELGLTPDKASP
jgi:hypothetical protein